MLDYETQNELRRKKLCFSYEDPRELGHKCIEKVKVHYIKALWDNNEEEEIGYVQDGENRSVYDEIHMWKLRVELFLFYQVLLDLTLSMSGE